MQQRKNPTSFRSGSVKAEKKVRTICFYCGDDVEGPAHKELCLSWKEAIKKQKKVKKID
jgi:hypothetical protein